MIIVKVLSKLVGPVLPLAPNDNNRITSQLSRSCFNPLYAEKLMLDLLRPVLVPTLSPTRWKRDTVHGEYKLTQTKTQGCSSVRQNQSSAISWQCHYRRVWNPMVHRSHLAWCGTDSYFEDSTLKSPCPNPGKRLPQPRKLLLWHSTYK